MSGQPRAALVCLDLQRERLTGDGAMATAEVCRRALDQARRLRWPVLHVHGRTAPGPGGRPITGLEPLPSEAIFQRHGPSAFTNASFAQTALALGGPLVLIGFSLCDTVLATAFAAADRNISIEILDDAVGGEAATRRILFKPLAGLAPRARVLAFRDLFLEDATRFAAANLP